MPAHDYIDWFIGSGLRRAGPDAASRARLVVWLSLALTLSSFVYSGVHLLFGSGVVAALGVSAAMALGAVPYILRVTSNVSLAGNILSGIVFGFMSFALWMRGVPGTPMMNVLCFPPVIALVLSGRNSGYFWLVLSLFEIAGLGLMAALGSPFPDRAPLEYQEAITVILPVAFVGIVFCVGLVYEHLQNEGRQALEHARIQSQMLMAALPDLIFRMDVNGVILDFKVPPATPLPSNLNGRNINELFPNLDLRGSTLSDDQPGEGRLRVFETRLRMGEEIRDYEIHAVNVSERGLVVVMRDMTAWTRSRERLLEVERRRVEDEAEARVARAGRMAQVGVLAAGVAHEINNPLSFVIGNLDFLNTNLTSDDDDVVDAIREALDGAQRIRRIVRDVSVFAGADDDETVDSIDVHAVLESSINLAFSEIRHRAILTRKFGTVPSVNGNAARLGQVFVNLLVNAAQSIPEGSSKGMIRVETWEESGQAVVAIIDNGIGIDEESREKIFEPFFTTKGEKTGLGLSIVQGIVSKLDGRLEVESRLGGGSTFRVRLPASGAEPETLRLLSDEMPTDVQRKSGRVLVVDDDERVARAISRSLASYEVESVFSGEAALARLGQEPPCDVVLCDVMMPGLSGMDVYETIAAERPEWLPRLLFMTGGTFTKPGRAFLERVGAERCVEKPPDMDRLEQLIQAILVKTPASAGQS